MNRVLVIDDNELAGMLVASYLVRYGWEVQALSKPFGVLNKIKEYRPEVILLDLRMPGLSGSKLASLIRDHKEMQGLKIISFSSEEAEVQDGLVKTGLVDGYFVKNRNLEGLAETIEDVTRKDPPAA